MGLFGGCLPGDALPWFSRLPDLEIHAEAVSDGNRSSAIPVGEGFSPWLAGVRRMLVRVTWQEGIFRVGLLALLVVGSLLALDAAFELPRGLRVIGSLLGLGLIVRGLILWVWRPVARIPREDALALWVERRSHGFRSRLISSLQLGRNLSPMSEAAAFVDRMQREAGGLAGAVTPVALVPEERARVRRAGLRVGGVVLVFLATLAWSWPVSAVLVRRLFWENLAMPRRTRIVEVSGAMVVGRGDDVRIRARVEGKVPKSGRLLIKHETGRVQEMVLDAETPGAREFVRVLGGVPASFGYSIRLNDAETEQYRVEVLPRPVVTNLVLTQVLPRYTGLAPRRVVPGELSILRGSRLRVEGVASQPLKEARVRLLGVERAVDLSVEPGAGDRFSGEVVVDDARMLGMTVEMVDRRDIPSRDAAVYAMSVVADEAPKVRVLSPVRREELVTPRGTVLVAFEAKDDFGLGSLRIRYQPASATNREPGLIELDLAGETNGVVRRRFEWRLSTVQPPLLEGSMVEFWVEAADRNDGDGPGIGRSDRYLLRVVTEAEKRADLLGRAGDAIGRLGDVAQGQERLNDSLGRLILARPATP